MRWCDRQIGPHSRTNEAARRAARITGIGQIGASALSAAVGEFKQFKNGRHQVDGLNPFFIREYVLAQGKRVCERYRS